MALAPRRSTGRVVASPALLATASPVTGVCSGDTEPTKEEARTGAKEGPKDSGTPGTPPDHPGASGRLSVDGVILSAGANNAQVRLDEILWDGEAYCTPGTYTFGVE